MRREDFIATSPGELVDLSEGGLAFVPARLSESRPLIPLTPSLVNAADEARGALGELVGQARLIANVELVTHALSLREAVLSSRMEGTETTVQEMILQEVTQSTVLEDSDHREVQNYLETIRLASAWLHDGRRVGLPLVKDLHSRLMRGVRGDDKNPGGLRTRNVFIGARHLGLDSARFVPPPVEQVPSLAEDLFTFTSGSRWMGPLIDCAIAHYQFETIHPFEDGNGRLGRLLIPLHLMDWAVIDRPLIYLGPYFESHSDEYRDGLLAVSTVGAWESWVNFFLRAFKDTAADGLVRAKRVLDLQEDYRRRVAATVSSKFTHAALEHVFRWVVVSVPRMQQATGATAPTARRIIDAMVHVGILQPTSRLEGTQYWIAAELQDEVFLTNI